MDYLAERRLIAADTRAAILGNRLVLVVPADSPARVDLAPGFDFAALLGPDGRWVTGDPSSVPVGRYAQQALTALGAWNVARTRLVRAENVRVALAFVERGEAAAGIVYATDAAIAPRVRVAGVFPSGPMIRSDIRLRSSLAMIHRGARVPEVRRWCGGGCGVPQVWIQ